MKIKFLPTNQEIDGDPNKTLLQLCTENGIEIRSICKGVPSCAECRVRVVGGEHNLIPPNRVELGLIGNNYFLDGRRLSCQVRCFGPITVDLTEQIERQDNPNKKVRGFRQQDRSIETQAVQGTLVLEEKPVAGPVEGGTPKGEPRDDQPRRESRRDQPRREGRRRDGGRRGEGGGSKKGEGRAKEPKIPPKANT